MSLLLDRSPFSFTSFASVDAPAPPLPPRALPLDLSDKIGTICRCEFRLTGERPAALRVFSARNLTTLVTVPKARMD